MDLTVCKQKLDDIKPIATSDVTKAVIAAFSNLVREAEEIPPAVHARAKAQGPAVAAGADAATEQAVAGMRFMTHEDRMSTENGAKADYEQKEARRIAQGVVAERRYKLEKAVTKTTATIRDFRKHKAQRVARLRGPQAFNHQAGLPDLLKREHARAEVENWPIQRIAEHCKALVEADDDDGLEDFWAACSSRVGYFADTPVAELAKLAKGAGKSAEYVDKQRRIARSLQFMWAEFEERKMPEEVRELEEFEQRTEELWRDLCGYSPAEVNGMGSGEFWKYAASPRDPWAVKPDWPLRFLAL